MHTLILGIGNILRPDEGLGPRCMKTLALPDTVRLPDGGTQGLYLLPLPEDVDALLVFDAIDHGLPPGTLRRIKGDAVPAFLGARKMSLYQTGFQQVIATARLLGRCPARMVLIGCQPVAPDDFGGGLYPASAARIPRALEMAAEVPRGWGVPVAPGRTATGDLAGPANSRAA